MVGESFDEVLAFLRARYDEKDDAFVCSSCEKEKFDTYVEIARAEWQRLMHGRMCIVLFQPWLVERMNRALEFHCPHCGERIASWPGKSS